MELNPFIRGKSQNMGYLKEFLTPENVNSIRDESNSPTPLAKHILAGLA